MDHARRSRLVPLAPAVALAAALALASSGCSGDDGDKAKKEPTASPTMVEGLTVPGVDIAFGDKATFEWKPNPDFTAKAEVSVEEVQVATTKDLAGYELTPAMAASTPYFVDVTVKNVGKSDLGGKVLPIYLDNDTGTLFPAAVIPHFQKCSPRALPEEFAPGASGKLCLIFLAPEGTSLRSVALMPTEGEEQIDWTGNVEDPLEKETSASASPSATSSPSATTSPSVTPGSGR